jgi:prepilin peptidase CpaA
MNRILLTGVVSLVVLAAVIDVRTRKIPNWLTFSSCLIVLGANLIIHGVTGFLGSLLGLFTGFGLLFFVYLLGGMGAGDVKLLSAVGAFIGPRLVFHAFVWMALSGGVMAVGLILYKRVAADTLRNLKTLLFGWLTESGGRDMNLTLQNQSLHKLTYGVAIAIGTLLAVYFQRLPGLVIGDGAVHFTWL